MVVRAYSEHGMVHEVQATLERMILAGVRPNEVALNPLPCAADTKSLAIAKHIHQHILSGHPASHNNTTMKSHPNTFDCHESKINAVNHFLCPHQSKMKNHPGTILLFGCFVGRVRNPGMTNTKPALQQSQAISGDVELDTL